MSAQAEMMSKCVITDSWTGLVPGMIPLLTIKNCQDEKADLFKKIVHEADTDTRKRRKSIALIEVLAT
jgi:hypothetical protein